MSRVVFVMQIEVDDSASSFRPPNVEGLRAKMNRVLHCYHANPDIDSAWVKSCKIRRVVHFKNDGSTTAV